MQAFIGRYRCNCVDATALGIHVARVMRLRFTLLHAFCEEHLAEGYQRAPEEIERVALASSNYRTQPRVQMSPPMSSH
eukprot:663059-Pyramimonas_sp.AAC.1